MVIGALTVSSAILTSCKLGTGAGIVTFEEEGDAESSRVKLQREKFATEVIEIGTFKKEFDENQIQSTCGISVGRSFECFARRADAYLKRTGPEALTSYGLTLLVAVGDQAYDYERRGKPTDGQQLVLAVDYMDFMLKVAQIAHKKRATFDKDISTKRPSLTLSNEENQLWKLSMKAIERAERILRMDEGSRLAQLQHNDRLPASDPSLRNRLFELQRQLQRARLSWRPSRTGLALNVVRN